MAFFELRTARDMLEKARREHARLKLVPDIDNVFNFFVTATHIQDYVRHTTGVDRAVLQAFVQDQDLMDCRDMCDKAKHSILTKRADPLIDQIDFLLGHSAMGEAPLGMGPPERVIHRPTRRVNVDALAGAVLAKWEAFFSAHGL